MHLTIAPSFEGMGPAKRHLMKMVPGLVALTTQAPFIPVPFRNSTTIILPVSYLSLAGLNIAFQTMQGVPGAKPRFYLEMEI